MFNRLDDEVNHLTNCYKSLCYSFLDTLNLRLRDFHRVPTKIPADVRVRRCKANMLTILGGVTHAVADFYFVKRGLVRPSVLGFGAHTLAQEFHPPSSESVHASVMAPLHEYSRQYFQRQLTQAGWTGVIPAEVWCVRLTGECECPDSWWRGPGRGACCAHKMAAQWRHNHQTDAMANAAAVRDLAETIRRRESRVAVPQQELWAKNGSDQEIRDMLVSRAQVVVDRSNAMGPLPSSTAALDELQSVDPATTLVNAPSVGLSAVTHTRPKSSYLRFCDTMRSQLDKTLSFADAGKELGMRWRALGDNGQLEYKQAYEKDVIAFQAALLNATQPEQQVATSSAISQSGPRPKLATKARHAFRNKVAVVDSLRPTVGLKAAAGARGGGGTGSRINTDASHRGRSSRIGAASRISVKAANKIKSRHAEVIAAEKEGREWGLTYLQ